MNPISQRINQQLRQRKQQRQKVQRYRNKRIKHKFYKLKQQEHDRQQADQKVRTVQDQRKIQFYNQVFGKNSGSNIMQQQGNQNQIFDRRKRSDNINQLKDQIIQEQNFGNQTKNQIKKQYIHEKKDTRQQKYQNFSLKNNKKHQQSKNNQYKSKNFSKNEGFRNEKPQINELQKLQIKANKLKEKKKKFIKKLDQKTKKGQPIMNNYVKYALSKLEQTIVREKIGKKNADNKNKSISHPKRKETKNFSQNKAFFNKNYK